MKAYELRIGNLVNYQTAEGDILVARIDWQDLKWISKDEKGFNIAHSAIPLTEEWLLRMGFQLCNNYYHTYFDTYRAEIRVKQNGNGFAIRLKRNNSMMWLCNVEYVHQLQNLYFALTGEELTIKTK